MSPEQALGIAVDGRSDQYSLAVVGYRMLTGEALFDGDSSMAILYKHIHQAPPRIRTLRPDVPVHIELATLRALSKSPTQRFDSMTAFARALRGESPVTFIELPTEAHGTHPEGAITGAETVPLETTPVPGRKRKVSVLAMLGLLGVVAGGTWWAARPRQEPPSQSPPTVTGTDTTAHVTAPTAPLVDSAARSAAPAPKRTGPRQHPAPQVHAADTAATAPEFASAPLTVNATPFGTLFVDDVRVGGTPVVNYALARGDHSIRVEREGCKPKNERISVTGPSLIKRLYALECTP